jgi:hypothetical protein
MGVLHFWCSIRKLTFHSNVMGIALTGMLTSPMLMLPDLVGWLGMGSRLSSSSLPLCTSSGGFNFAITNKRNLKG